MENEMNYYELAVAKFGVELVEGYCSYVECGAEFEVDEFDFYCYVDCAWLAAGGEF